MSVKVTTAPTADALDLSDVKLFLREDDSDEDELILRLVTSATTWWENFTGQKLINQTVSQTYDDFSDVMTLLRHPVSSVTSVSYLDDDGNSQTLSTSVYDTRLNASPARIELGYNQTWPSVQSVSEAVTVAYVAGYGSSYTSIPAEVRHALEQLVLVLYDNRQGIPTVGLGAFGNEKGIPFGVMQTAWNYRVVEFA